MARIIIYLPDKLENKARKAAQSVGKSVSRWIADQIASGLEDVWPQSVLDAAGAIPDFPELDELRKRYGTNSPRMSRE